MAAPAHGGLSLNADGSFVYTPNTNYHGKDSFTYRAHDGQSASNLATVNISVTPVNDAPVATPDAYEVDQDAVLSIMANGVLNNDGDIDGDILSVVAWSGTSTQGGQVVLNSNGSFTYTPPSGFTVTDSFSYRASDGSLLSNLATVSIEVSANLTDALYVYDIRFESRYWGWQQRAVFEIRWDSNQDGQGGPLTLVAVVSPSPSSSLANALPGPPIVTACFAQAGCGAPAVAPMPKSSTWRCQATPGIPSR